MNGRYIPNLQAIYTDALKTTRKPRIPMPVTSFNAPPRQQGALTVTDTEDEVSPEAIKALTSKTAHPADWGENWGAYRPLPGEPVGEFEGEVVPPTTKPALTLTVPERTPAPVATSEKKPGLLSRIGQGLKAALLEGLKGAAMGRPGYQQYLLQKEMLPMQEQLIKTKAGIEQQEAGREFDYRKQLIEHQQRMQQQYAPVQQEGELETARKAYREGRATPAQVQLLGLQSKTETPSISEQASFYKYIIDHPDQYRPEDVNTAMEKWKQLVAPAAAAPMPPAPSATPTVPASPSPLNLSPQIQGEIDQLRQAGKPEDRIKQYIKDTYGINY